LGGEGPSGRVLVFKTVACAISVDLQGADDNDQTAFSGGGGNLLYDIHGFGS
jgi:hypothetical protein